MPFTQNYGLLRAIVAATAMGAGLLMLDIIVMGESSGSAECISIMTLWTTKAVKSLHCELGHKDAALQNSCVHQSLHLSSSQEKSCCHLTETQRLREVDPG